MRKIFLILICLQAFVCFFQNQFDSKIIVSVSDSVDLYEKTKMSLLYLNLIVEENPSKDTLTAFARHFLPIGYIVTKAVVSGNKVVFFGIYGIKRTDVWNYPKLPKNYSNIIYYKGSKAWYIMLQRAAGVSGKLSYGK